VSHKSTILQLSTPTPILSPPKFSPLAPQMLHGGIWQILFALCYLFTLFNLTSTFTASEETSKADFSLKLFVNK